MKVICLSLIAPLQQTARGESFIKKRGCSGFQSRGETAVALITVVSALTPQCLEPLRGAWLLEGRTAWDALRSLVRALERDSGSSALSSFLLLISGRALDAFAPS